MPSHVSAKVFGSCLGRLASGSSALAILITLALAAPAAAGTNYVIGDYIHHMRAIFSLIPANDTA